MTPVFRACGERAVTVEFGDTIDPDVNDAVIRLGAALDAAPFDGMVETVPTYRSLLIVYDPLVVRGRAVERQVADRLSGEGPAPAPPRRWRIPVHYGGAAALDLENLADEKGMTPDALIALHSGADYRVYMIGFAPGFAYLGGVPERLHTPRLTTPRQHVPAGAIGLGGQQASINSVAGPSGWRFIGQTPVRAFDPRRADPVLFRAGDRIAFYPVSADEAAQAAIPEPEAAP